MASAKNTVRTFLSFSFLSFFLFESRLSRRTETRLTVSKDECTADNNIRANASDSCNFRTRDVVSNVTSAFTCERGRGRVRGSLFLRETRVQRLKPVRTYDRAFRFRTTSILSRVTSIFLFLFLPKEKKTKNHARACIRALALKVRRRGSF